MGGKTKKMGDVEVGDFVLSSDGEYSQVFMWTHRITKGLHSFVRLDTDSGKPIELSDGHFIEINAIPLPAGSAKIGDKLRLSCGCLATVLKKCIVKRIGPYYPQNMSGENFYQWNRCFDIHFRTQWRTLYWLHSVLLSVRWA